MDRGHVAHLKERKPAGSNAHISLFGDWDGSKEQMIDPWYDSDLKGFQTCFKQCRRFSEALLDALVAESTSK
jgi:low molecular weight phosphotyrosine protein phosphatase